MPSGEQVIAAISKVMPGSIRYSYSTAIKVKDLFPEEKSGEKLVLENVDFYRLGPDFIKLDFSGCILKSCRFDHLTVSHCIFDDADIRKNNTFDDCFIEGSNQGLESESKSELSYGRILTQLEDYDGDSFGRKQRCWKERCEKYPEDFLTYEKVVFGIHPLTCPMDDQGTDFYYFMFPGVEALTQGTGWKLHVSINREIDNMKKAFDLLVPYLAKQQYYFKFCKPDDRQYGRLFSNSQFTIYLTLNNQSRPLQQVKNMMEDITDLFKKNNIKPAVSISSSDAPTLSPYFTIRNDKLYLPACFVFDDGTGDYLSADEVGHNYNPCKNLNPYQALLKSKTEKSFDLLEHFYAFSVQGKGKDRVTAYIALRCCMLAYLQEYALIPEGIEAFSFKAQCIDQEIDLDDKFIKKDYQKNAEIRKGIRIACCILDYLSSAESLDYQPAFSEYFSGDGSFLKALKEIEKLIVSSSPELPKHGYSFKNHMKALNNKKTEPTTPRFLDYIDAIEAGSELDSRTKVKLF